MLKQIGANWMVTALTVVVTYVLMPWNIRHLGQDAYGTWLLITSLTGYLGLLALGAPMASVRYLAQYKAEGKTKELNQTVGTFAGLYIGLGAASLAVGFVLFLFFTNLYDVPPALQSKARLAFALVMIHVSAGFFQQLPYGIMAAHQDFVFKNVCVGGGLLLRLGLTLVLVAMFPSVHVLAAIQLSVLAFEMIVSWSIVKRKYPDIQVKVAHFDTAMLRKILSFSMYVLILHVGVQLSFQTDSLVIGGFLDIGQIPYYSVANSLTFYLMEFIIAIAAVVMPTATKLQAEGKLTELRDVYLKWSKISLSLTLLAGVFMLVLGPRFLAWWIGPGFEGPSGAVLRILMASFIVFLPVRGVAQPILMGLGKPGRPTLAFLVAGVLNLVLSVALVRPYRLVGVAWGTAIPNVVFALATLTFACRELELPLTSYFRYVFLRPLLGAIPVAAVLYWFLRVADVHSFQGLFVAGLAMLAAFGVVWVVFVYRSDPYLDLWARLRLRRQPA